MARTPANITIDGRGVKTLKINGRQWFPITKTIPKPEWTYEVSNIVLYNNGEAVGPDLTNPVVLKTYNYISYYDISGTLTTTDNVSNDLSYQIDIKPISGCQWEDGTDDTISLTWWLSSIQISENPVTFNSNKSMYIFSEFISVEDRLSALLSTETLFTSVDFFSNSSSVWFGGGNTLDTMELNADVNTLESDTEFNLTIKLHVPNEDGSSAGIIDSVTLNGTTTTGKLPRNLVGPGYDVWIDYEDSGASIDLSWDGPPFDVLGDPLVTVTCENTSDIVGFDYSWIGQTLNIEGQNSTSEPYITVIITIEIPETEDYQSAYCTLYVNFKRDSGYDVMGG